mmetsp:Transcript_17548/g.49369  ORF Transcript_17548/g.49369 Transcript_17548/m.49369 type:complete len:720 (+) Transcript_17548:28-2187(+)
MSCAAFETLGIMPELIAAVEELGWELPTNIQAECIPLILGGGDILAAAETGSGKTGAFALPLLQVVWETLRNASLKKDIAEGSTSVPSTPALSLIDRDASLAIDESGLLAQCRQEVQWQGCRANLGIVGGKYYYEAKITDEGLARVGFSSRAASLNLGTDKNGFGYGGTAKKSNNRQFNDYGVKFGKNDVIGCYLDCDEGEISFAVNGEHQGMAFTVPKHMLGFPIYPALVLKNAEVRINFGATPFAHPPLQGFCGIAKAHAKDIAVAQMGSSPITKSGGRRPLSLILEPTRELAEQTHNAIISYKKHLGNPSITCRLLVGGQPAKQQVKGLKEGADIVTGTPGRVVDLVQSGSLDVSAVRFYVLDEADRLLDTGNFASIMKCHDAMGKASAFQVLLFSATLHSPDVARLSEKICQFPTWVDLKGRDTVPDTVDQAVVVADPTVLDLWKSVGNIKTDGIHRGEKVKNLSSPEGLSEATKRLKFALVPKIIEANTMEQAIIFCRTRLDCDNLERYLQSLTTDAMRSSFVCASLHSGKNSKDRRENLEKFKNGEVPFLICTDVAARGLDVQGLPYAINVTLPDNPSDYIHRIGRVGRAERMGLAVTILANHKEKVWYHKCKSRGSGCSDSRLVSDGGCAIWYDEDDLYQQVQAVADAMIPLDEDFKFSNPSGGSYGKKRGKQEEYTDFEDHRDYLSSAVGELSQLEEACQVLYFEFYPRTS